MFNERERRSPLREASNITRRQCRRMSGRWHRRGQPQVRADTNEEQPFSILRNTVPDRVKHGIAYSVSPSRQIGCSLISYISSSNGKHSGNIFHYYSERSPQFRRVKKPEI